MHLKVVKNLSKIDNILNKCIWLLHENKSLSNLDYLSRIDGEDTAWYFWLTATKGVYELKLNQVFVIENKEISSFYIRYYPDLDEECFNNYSCSEQLLRLSDIFAQTKVQIAETIDSCPCCGTTQCEHEHTLGKQIERNKGIPKLLQRKTLSPKLFTIGKLEFEIVNTMLTSMTLTTAKKFLEYANEEIQITTKDGLLQKLIDKNDLDREVAGLDLCLPFQQFLLDNLLTVLLLKTIKQTSKTMFVNDVLDFDTPQNFTHLEKVVITNIFSENHLA